MVYDQQGTNWKSWSMASFVWHILRSDSLLSEEQRDVVAQAVCPSHKGDVQELRLQEFSQSTRSRVSKVLQNSDTLWDNKHALVDEAICWLEEMQKQLDQATKDDNIIHSHDHAEIRTPEDLNEPGQKVVDTPDADVGTEGTLQATTNQGNSESTLARSLLPSASIKTGTPTLQDYTLQDLMGAFPSYWEAAKRFNSVCPQLSDITKFNCEQMLENGAQAVSDDVELPHNLTDTMDSMWVEFMVCFLAVLSTTV